MDPIALKYILLGILIFSFLGEQFLEYLNVRQWKPEMPEEFVSFTNPATYRRAASYHRDKFKIGMIQSLTSVILMLILIWTGALGYLSDLLFAEVTQDQVWHSLALFGILGFGSSLLGLPFAYYRTFVLESKYGFNRTTPGVFWTDRIKGLFLTVIIGGAVGWLLLTIILHTGPRFWLYAWAVMAGISLLATMLYTSILLPMFNKLTPLTQGPLRNMIEDYGRKVAFPISNIFIMDGSKRSSKANAFFSGLGGTRKIVLFDTLVNKHTEEEVVAVLAHEVGHYKHRHILKGFILGQITTGLTLWLLSLFIGSPAPAQALGAEMPSLGLNLLAFGMLYNPVSALLGIAVNALSRKHEFEADAYAAQTADKEAFKSALLKLSTDSLSNPHPHPAYVFMHYSHPPVIERINALG